MSSWSKSRFLYAAAAVLAVAGCGRLRYSYAPVTTTSAEVEGHAAAVVTMPPDAAKGELRMASLGVASVAPPPGVTLAPFRALFVRFVVVNDSAEPWVFDEAEQRIEIRERDKLLVRWARTATGERPPLVSVPAHGSISLDVLFPVDSRDAGDLSRFDVQWTVRQGARMIAGRAEFTRHLEAREPAPAAFDPGEAPPYRMQPRLPTEPCLP